MLDKFRQFLTNKLYKLQDEVKVEKELYGSDKFACTGKSCVFRKRLRWAIRVLLLVSIISIIVCIAFLKRSIRDMYQFYPNYDIYYYILFILVMLILFTIICGLLEFTTYTEEEFEKYRHL